MTRSSFAVVAAFLLAGCAGTADIPTVSTNDDVVTTKKMPGDPNTSETSDPLAGGSGTTTPKALLTVDCKVGLVVGKQTELGCEITYDIDLAAAGLQLPGLCQGGLTVYNDCSGDPVDLAWKDVGDHTPKSVRIEVGVSLFCADPLGDLLHPSPHSVSVNDGSTFGGFEPDRSACTCAAPTKAYTFEMSESALASYHAGGDNTLNLNGKNRCLGLGSLGAGGSVARIIATY